MKNYKIKCSKCKKLNKKPLCDKCNSIYDIPTERRNVSLSDYISFDRDDFLSWCKRYEYKIDGKTVIKWDNPFV